MFLFDGVNFEIMRHLEIVARMIKEKAIMQVVITIFVAGTLPMYMFYRYKNMFNKIDIFTSYCKRTECYARNTQYYWSFVFMMRTF